MKVIILADRRDPRLTGDPARACAALLPVGGRPLVAHTLDALAAAGLRRATLVVRERDLEAVRVALAAETLPMELEYHARAEQQAGPDAIVQRLQPDLTEELLVVRGDILRSACIGDFLKRAQAFPGAYTLSATIGGVPAGLRLVRAGAAHPVGLAREPEADWHEGPPRIELAGAALALLTSPAEYHRALLDALRGRYSGLTLGGRHATDSRRPAQQPPRPLTALAGRVLAWVALLVALPLWPLAILAGRVAEDSRRDGGNQPDALNWLAALAHVRELQPAVLRPAHVSARPRA